MNEGPLPVEISREIGQKLMAETECAFRKRYSPDVIIEDIDRLREATKPISCIRGKEADGGTVDFVDVPDNQTRLGATKFAAELAGYVGKKSVIDTKLSGTIEVKWADSGE